MSIKYAIGEIVLIFVGISLAIWFDNWNQERRDRQVERAMLMEIHEGVKTDLEDMRLTRHGHSMRVNAYKVIADHLVNNLPNEDSLSQYFGTLYGKSSLITNRAPYETLKSRGIDLVTNDDLRQAILTYYDIKLDWLEFNEREHVVNHRQYIEPLIINHLQFERKISESDYRKLKADDKVVAQLRLVLLNDRYVLELYDELIASTEELYEDLAEELNINE